MRIDGLNKEQPAWSLLQERSEVVSSVVVVVLAGVEVHFSFPLVGVGVVLHDVRG
jgi:hypothetical protein